MVLAKSWRTDILVCIKNAMGSPLYMTEYERSTTILSVLKAVLQGHGCLSSMWQCIQGVDMRNLVRLSSIFKAQGIKQ